jgi:inorganic pyrophosphatase
MNMETVTVIIETPKGKGLKYDFDPATGYFVLKKVMPAGLVFPFDFGFIPNTLGEDGDPLDVVVISELESFPGCAMECRIIGAIKASQKERDGQTMRNDRYLAIPVVSSLYADVDSLAKFPKEIIDQLENFFKNYNEQAGKEFHVLEQTSAKKAMSMIENSRLQPQADKLFQIYLPRNQENGKPFSEERFKKVKTELTERFGGLTMYTRAPAKGLWKDEGEKTVSDDILIFEVMASEYDQEFWKDYKAELEKKFKQDEVLIRCSTIQTVSA